jgi:hypothetical protein
MQKRGIARMVRSPILKRINYPRWIMLLKLMAGVLFTVGFLTARAPADEKAGDCCKAKMTCCTKEKACCAAMTKSGCCTKGKECCGKDKTCCAAPQECCRAGAKCCDEAKACCGAPINKEAPKKEAKACCGTDACCPAK